MKCFYFSNREKNVKQKSTKSISIPSSNSISMSTDHEIRRCGSEFTSQNASDSQNVSSDFSTQSSSKNAFEVLSQRHNNLREFTLSELKIATKNFNRSLMIGEGGFGCVYKGVIRSLEDPNKNTDIAVKQLSRRGLQGHREWVTEVNVLGVVEHPNLVKLLGYCAEDDERGIQRLLIYEYMPNRSVQDHLSSRFQTSLSWTSRLIVAQHAARGLAYLHEGMDFQIIFRDFKSSNILLDEQWNAKLSDFGLARLGPSDGFSHVSTMVVGTMGYAAPEYIQTGHLSLKSDVWSYGVFLYELITGRRPLDRNRPKNEQKLLDWIRPHLLDQKKFRLILDPRLEGKYNLKSALKLAAVANKCLVRHPKERPTMSEILEMVNSVVNAADPASPQLPLKLSIAKDDAEKFNDAEKSRRGRLKRRFVDLITGAKGSLIWIRRPKLVRTSSKELTNH